MNRRLFYFLLVLSFHFLLSFSLYAESFVIESGEVFSTPGKSGDINYSDVDIHSGATFIVKSGDRVKFSGSTKIKGSLIIESDAGVSAVGSTAMGGGTGQSVVSDAKIVLKELSYLALIGSFSVNKPGGYQSYIEVEGSTIVEICSTFSYFELAHFLRYVGKGATSYFITRGVISGNVGSKIGDSPHINWISMQQAAFVEAGHAKLCGHYAKYETCPDMWPPGSDRDWISPGNGAMWNYCGFAVEVFEDLPRDNFWMGGTPGSLNDWNEEKNWTAGLVPKEGDDVIFATEENCGLFAIDDLHVPSDKIYAVGNLKNESFKSLVIPPASTIVVSKEITGSSELSEAYKILIKADSDEPNGSFIATDMCSKGAVYATVELFASGRKLTEEELSQKWTDNISGSPTENMNLYSNHIWQHIGIPVEGISASPTFDRSWLRKYSEAQNGSIFGPNGIPTFYDKWSYVGADDEMRVFDGYEITQDEPKIYNIKGKLNFCDRELTLTRKAVAVCGIARTCEYQHYGLGQNIFGNSYTAAIDLDYGIEFNSDDIEQTVYLYRSGSFQQWGGGLLSISLTEPNAGSYVAIPAKVSSEVWENQIPSMQGFLLKFKPESTIYDAPDQTVTLRYGNGGVVSNKKPQLTPQFAKSYLTVTMTSATTVDRVWLFSQEGTDDGFDNGWDGFKYFGTPTAFLYSESPDGPLQVNSSSSLDHKVLTIQANSDKEYVLELKRNNLYNYDNLSLVDLVTRDIIPLTEDVTRYSFIADHAGKRVKRFVIIDSENIDFDKYKLLDAYLTGDNDLVLTNLTTRNGRATVFDLSGKQVFGTSLNVGITHCFLNLSSGIYILHMEAGGKRESVKLMIK